MPASPALDIVIVGPGRLGRSAVMLLSGGPHRVRLVGRGESIPTAPLTWLTVPDRAIAEAARAVPIGGVVLHASGATDESPLRPHRPAGSLHPLMTFPGADVGLPSREPPLPAAVAGDPDAITAATQLAQAMGFFPFPVPGDRRLYHAAAVMAGNQVTALLGLAAEILAAAGVPRELAPGLLAPLAQSSLANAARLGPARALTGPVARGDEAVLTAHADALTSLPPEVQDAYRVLTTATRRLLAASLEPPPDDSGPTG